MSLGFGFVKKGEFIVENLENRQKEENKSQYLLLLFISHFFFKRNHDSYMVVMFQCVFYF